MMWFTKSRRAHDEDDYETWMMGGVVPTLNVFDNNSESRATILIIDGTRVNDVRVYEDGIMPTVISRYGTGGGNVPMVFPIQDGRDLEKHQNGLGVGDEGDPAYTVDTVSRQAVVMRDREGKAGGGRDLLYRTKPSHSRLRIFILFSLTPLLFADLLQESVNASKGSPMIGLKDKQIHLDTSRWATR